jgi:transcriptional regulator with XRE-family HTH domain
MKIGSKIKSIRESKRMTQNAVAERAGMRQGAYSQLENDLFDPRPETLERISRALGLSDEEGQDIIMEVKLNELNMLEPDFVMMLKDVPSMASNEKQSIIDAYELVKFRRARKSHD